MAEHKDANGTDSRSRLCLYSAAILPLRRIHPVRRALCVPTDGRTVSGRLSARLPG